MYRNLKFGLCGLIAGLSLLLATSTIVEAQSTYSKQEAKEVANAFPLSSCWNGPYFISDGNAGAGGGCGCVDSVLGTGQTGAPSNAIEGVGGGGAADTKPASVKTPTGYVDHSMQLVRLIQLFSIGKPLSGCSSCGTAPPTNSVPTLIVNALLRLRDFGKQSSFGPGFFSDYDITLALGGSGTSQADMLHPRESFNLRFQHSANGVYLDNRNKSIRDLRLLDATGNPTANLADADTAVLTTHSGTTVKFDIFPIQVETYPPYYTTEYHGRLIETKDLRGLKTTITYRDSLPAGQGGFTQQQLIDSPERMWQIYQVTDALGKTATFQYAAQQVGGLWAVNQIDVPGGNNIQFEYLNDKLHKITHVDGSESTFDFSTDAYATTLAVHDPAAPAADIDTEIRMTNLGSTADSQDPNAEVYTSASMMCRMVANGNDEVTYLNFQGDYMEGNVSDYALCQYAGAGRMARTGGPQFFRYLEDGWEKRTPSSGKAAAGTLEACFASALFTGTNSIPQNIPTEITDDTGRLTLYEYDTNTFVTKKTYDADGTYETWQYNANHQITRYRDRLGRVVKYEFDAQGNQTKQKIGILEVSGSDVNQPEYAEYVYEYYASGHANQFLLKAAKDPLYDPANPDLHVTEFEYNANNQLVKEIAAADVTGGARPETVYAYDALGRLETSTDPRGRVTTYQYDSRNRTIEIAYSDGSTQQTLYGATGSGQEGLVVKTKDRSNVVTAIAYDAAGRVSTRTVASAIDADILDGQADDTPITDPTQQRITSYTYQPGSGMLASVTSDGKQTSYVYDARGRQIETHQQPDAAYTLVTTSVYANNELFSTEDPYGRREYMGYRASDGALIRRVQATEPGYELVPEERENLGGWVPPQNNNPGGSGDYDTGYSNGFYAGAMEHYYGTYNGNPNYNGGDPYLAGYYDGYDDGYYGNPYGSGYDPSGGQAGTKVFDVVRDASLNALFVVADAITNEAGDLVEVIDGRGYTTKHEYDSQGRQIRVKNAEGTANETISETVYDLAGNVIETRAPRYFDSNDPEYQNVKTVSTYNGRNMLASTTAAPGTAIAATTGYTYYADGRRDTTTDARGNDWESYWHTCCATNQGQKNPAGHGSISNNDHAQRTTHTAVVEDYDSHPLPTNPVNAKTLAEATTRYDSLGRVSMHTQWLVPLGVVDPNDVPIAGENGEDEADGLTTRTLYDSNLADGVGLDSAAGIAVSKPGGGTYNVNIQACLTKLAETPANGGAAITFNATSAGSAVVSINAEHKLSVSISDAAGRGVMSAQIEPYNGSTPNALITWSCQQYDNVVTVSGFGDCLESRSIDALGNISKSRSDGAGRTLENEDADGNISTAKYDAGGNVKQSRDPNGVGFDAVYDELGRQTESSDTHGDTTKTVYNKASQAIEQEDAKQKKTLTVYDARGRRKTVTDRLTGVTSYDYDLNSNLTSITNAETRVTGYEYDVRNLKTKETYPDHVSGSTVGQPGYGIVEFAHDATGRVFRKTDQLGDTCTFNFDLAGRMTQRDYRTAANSPSGAIADSDVFTHNNSGQTLTATSGRYNNVVAMSYNIAGRLQNESLTISGQIYTVGHQYDTRGHLWKQTYPDGKIVERTYHSDGQLHQVKYDGNLVDTRIYDDGGRLEQSTYGNGVVTNFTYFDDNNTESITIKDASQSLIDSFTYTYDANKNVTGETRGGVMSGYSWNTNNSGAPGYDDDDRLTYWKHSDASQTQSWNLSLVGDWNSTTVNGTQQNRTHNAVHELTAIDSTPLTYDVKGNLTTNTNGHAYTWDFDNRMSGADTDGNSVDDVLCEYDSLGRRVRKNNGTTNTVYVLSGWQVVAEYASGAVPASPSEQYIYASYIDEPILKTGTGGGVYYSRNRQYSITALTNSTGAPLEYYAYDPHGKLGIFNASATSTSASQYANHFTYTCRRFEPETNLYYFRARYFDSTLGRFVGRDPLGYVDGMSLYRGYFAIGGLDPFGMSEVDAVPVPDGWTDLGEWRFGTQSFLVYDFNDFIWEERNEQQKFEINWKVKSAVRVGVSVKATVRLSGDGPLGEYVNASGEAEITIDGATNAELFIGVSSSVLEEMALEKQLFRRNKYQLFRQVIGRCHSCLSTTPSCPTGYFSESDTANRGSFSSEQRDQFAIDSGCVVGRTKYGLLVQLVKICVSEDYTRGAILQSGQHAEHKDAKYRIKGREGTFANAEEVGSFFWERVHAKIAESLKTLNSEGS